MSLLGRLSRIVTSHINDLRDHHAHDQDNPYPSGSYADATHCSDSSTVSKEEEFRANLEVSAAATIDEIRVSYKRLLKQYHPDLHASDLSKRELANQITQRLNEAMEYFESKHAKGVEN